MSAGDAAAPSLAFIFTSVEPSEASGASALLHEHPTTHQLVHVSRTTGVLVLCAAWFPSELAGSAEPHDTSSGRRRRFHSSVCLVFNLEKTRNHHNHLSLFSCRRLCELIISQLAISRGALTPTQSTAAATNHSGPGEAAARRFFSSSRCSVKPRISSIKRWWQVGEAAALHRPTSCSCTSRRTNSHLVL